jgi:cysteine-rich repeat protein
MTTRYPLLLVLALAAACGDNQKPNRPPTVADVSVTTAEDTAVAITVSPEDANGDALEITFTAPSNGSLAGTGASVMYTPKANFAGEETFKVTVSDGQATTIATITVTVQPVNDSPVAGNDTATTDENTPLTIAASPLLANDSDVDGQTLTITAVSGAVSGTVALSGTNVVFTPEADFSGSASFQYTVSDGTLTATATVTVTVNPVNDAPVATNVTVTTASNTSVAITLTATDVEGGALTFATTVPAHGALSGTGANRTYTPVASFAGQDSFTFEASDGALTSNTATVSITISPPPGCGDGNIDPGEVCDDSNRVAGDGCRADCRGQEVCGDGLVDSATGEQCDDGNTSSGDGCSASCQLDAFSNVPATVISGALNCNTATSNTGRKAAVDALGRFFVVMNCGGTGYVSVSLDRGQTWVAPTSLGITNVVEIAIEGGPTGTAYVVATVNPGVLMFTRTIDAGATWDAPRNLAAVIEPEVSIDSLGDTDLSQSNAYHEMIVDKISGDLFAVSDSPAFHIRRGSDAGASFGVSAPGTSSQVVGLPTDIGAGPLRSIDADALGNAYVATQRNTGNVQLDRMLFGATSIVAADARTVGAGTYPAVAALPSNTGALVAYTSGTSVYGAVVVY